MANNSLTPLHPCPWWLLFTFDNPLRRWLHNPHQILSPYVHPNTTVLDIGCGMGYFTLALARMVGAGGSVIAADVQQEMLDGLQRRIKRTGLLDRIQLLHSTSDRIGLEQQLDFALAFWVVHEMSQPELLLQEIYGALKPGGRFLVVEPKIHVSERAFENTVALGKSLGFQSIAQPKVWSSRAALWQK